jgi:type II secretory ATPase GspE/PulE/Tfp pilus assembly ATPase PilB-like protein
MGIPPFLIASSVEGVLAQRLVRKLCTECREPYQPDAEEADALGVGSSGNTLYRPKGCRLCKNSGYKGRLGIFELMIVDLEIKELLLQKASYGVITAQASRSQGMKTLRQDGIAKVLAGITSLEELNRVTIKEAPKVKE